MLVVISAGLHVDIKHQPVLNNGLLIQLFNISSTASSITITFPIVFSSLNYYPFLTGFTRDSDTGGVAAAEAITLGNTEQFKTLGNIRLSHNPNLSKGGLFAMVIGTF